MKKNELGNILEQMFKRNTVLINENDCLKLELSQAKAIIEEFMSLQHIFYPYRDCDDLTKILNEAEEFLKR